MGSSSMPSRVTSKWVGFVTALWVQAISGNVYTFANYSVALKAILQCDQVELNNLSVAKDIGKTFGVIAGLLADVLPPWSILLIGSLEGLLGYGVQWLVISEKIAPLPYWLMSIAMCLGGNSTTWMNTAVLITCLRNFRSNRGPASGILKGYVGLSAAIFTDLCAALFTSDPASFVLMLAVIPLAVCTIAMIFLRPIEPAQSQREEREESRGFTFLNTVAIFLALYLLSFDLSEPHGSLFSKIFASILLVILAAPLLLPGYLIIKLSSQCSGGGSCNRNKWSAFCIHFNSSKGQVDIDGAVPLLNDVENAPEEVQEEEKRPSPSGRDDLEIDMEESCKREFSTEHSDKQVGPVLHNEMEGVKEKLKPSIGEEHTIIQALQALDFWLLFFSFVCGVGTGLAVINNLGQIGQSLGYESVSIFISFTSIWGFFGRLGSGSMSEYLIRSAGVPRPLVMAASQLLMIVGFVLLAIAVPGSLYIGSIIVGTCYGIRIAVSVPTLAELFGLKQFGVLYNIIVLSLPLGSFVFSGVLAGFLYDREARKDLGIGMNGMLTLGGTKKPNMRELWNEDTYTSLSAAQSVASTERVLTCFGSHCYRLVFIAMAVVCAVGLVLDVLLALRTRRLYASLQRSKLCKK